MGGGQKAESSVVRTEILELICQRDECGLDLIFPCEGDSREYS